jgi:putative phosphoribosyl transferase
MNNDAGASVIAVRFRDRAEAGRSLVTHLEGYRAEDPVVVALPRGGVLVGYVVARGLGAPLQLLVARRVAPPGYAEASIGAVAEGGARIVDELAVRLFQVTETQLAGAFAEATTELERRVQRYREDGVPELEGRTVILVDDGLASGMTARAAILAIRDRRPRRLVLAAPVAAPATARALRPLVDDLVTVASDDFRTVGRLYHDFEQLPDEAVLELVARDAASRAGGAAVARLSEVMADGVRLRADIHIPARAAGVVLFAHGSGSSGYSARNLCLAHALRVAGLGTLLVDLLTADEQTQDLESGRMRFDIPLLARRLVGVTQWLAEETATRELRLGYLGASTGAAAALIAASERPERIAAIVSRSGRVDLARAVLSRVRAPTLLLVGGKDARVLAWNRDALARLESAEARLEVVPGATHLFEEPGALEAVIQHTTMWFADQLARVPAGTTPNEQRG